MPKAPPQHYYFLDFCRGVAALVVIAYHIGSTVGGTQYFGSGFLAVDFFFILSGFVIAHAYEQRLLTSMTFGEFLRARIIRLYPMAAVGVILGYAYCLGAWCLDPNPQATLASLHASLLANLLLVPNLWTAPTPASELFPLDGAIWSLFFELVLNLLFALVIVRQSNRMVAWLMALGAAVTLAFAVHQGTFNLGWNWQTAPGGLSRALFGFCAGMLIFRLRDRLALQLHGGGWIVLAALILLPVFDAQNLFVSAMAVFAVFPIIMVLGINVRWDRTIAMQKLSGNLSYPLYTMHLPVLAIAAAAFRVAMPHVAPDMLQLLLSLTVIAAAYIGFHCLDVPIRRWLGEIVRGQPQGNHQSSWTFLDNFSPSSTPRR